MWKRFLGALIEGCVAADPVVYIHYLAAMQATQADTEQSQPPSCAVHAEASLADSFRVRARVSA